MLWLDLAGLMAGLFWFMLTNGVMTAPATQTVNGDVAHFLICGYSVRL
jgi:hypothetical protein